MSREAALAWKFPSSQFSLLADGTLVDWIGPDPRPTEADIIQAEVDFVVVKDDVEADQDIKLSFEGDRIRRLIFEIEFDQESRLRILEGKPAITKAQYRDALVTRIRAL